MAVTHFGARGPPSNQEVPEHGSKSEPDWRRAQDGDPQALQAVVTRLLPRARNLVRYLVRGDSEVDDMAQIGLIAVVKGLAGYRGDAPLERWADRIVARETLRHVKRRRLKAAEQERAAVDLRLLTAEPAAPDAYGVRRELARHLDRLPEAQREALVLHHALGMTVPEVAQTVGASVNTVKSRMRLGSEKLRALLDGPEGGS